MDHHVIRHDDELPAPAGISYVLVVDDEPLVRNFLARCLEGGGYLVRQAANATDALDIMAGDPASVVLCDVRMPGYDGLWLTERLCTRWPDARVVMATGVDDLETIRQSRELGAVDYITKPIMPEQLLKVVLRAATARHDVKPPAEEIAPVLEQLPPLEEGNMEAEYALESPVRCPGCGERITTVRAVRLIRALNFTSTLPRRGRVLACFLPRSRSAELSNSNTLEPRRRTLDARAQSAARHAGLPERHGEAERRWRRRRWRRQPSSAADRLARSVGGRSGRFGFGSP